MLAFKVPLFIIVLALFVHNGQGFHEKICPHKNLNESLVEFDCINPIDGLVAKIKNKIRLEQKFVGSVHFKPSLPYHVGAGDLQKPKAEAENEGLSEDAKCYLACLFNCTGYLQENGELDLEMTLTPALMYENAEAHLAEHVNSSLTDCLKKVDLMIKQTTCDITYEISLCWLVPMELYLKDVAEKMNIGPIYNVFANHTRLLTAISVNLLVKNICN